MAIPSSGQEYESYKGRQGRDSQACSVMARKQAWFADALASGRHWLRDTPICFARTPSLMAIIKYFFFHPSLPLSM